METLELITEFKFVAIEIGTNEIIAGGNDANEVVKEAEKTGKQFIFSYVPEKNETFIF